MRNPNAHWRDSARTPRLFFVSAYAVFPLIIFLMHIRLWSFILCSATILFFAILERFGFKVPVFLRWAKCFLGGTRKMAKHWWHPL